MKPNIQGEDTCFECSKSFDTNRIVFNEENDKTFGASIFRHLLLSSFANLILVLPTVPTPPGQSPFRELQGKEDNNYNPDDNNPDNEDNVAIEDNYKNDGNLDSWLPGHRDEVYHGVNSLDNHLGYDGDGDNPHNKLIGLEDHVDFGSDDNDHNVHYPKIGKVYGPAIDDLGDMSPLRRPIKYHGDNKYKESDRKQDTDGDDSFQADQPMQVDEDGKLYFPYQINPRTHDVQTLVFVTPEPQDVNTPMSEPENGHETDGYDAEEGISVDADGYPLDKNGNRLDSDQVTSELNLLRDSIIRRKDKVSLRKLRTLLEFIKQNQGKNEEDIEEKWPENERWPKESTTNGIPGYRSVYGNVRGHSGHPPHGLNEESDRQPTLFNWKSVDGGVQADGHVNGDGINWSAGEMVNSEERRRKARSKSGQKEEFPGDKKL